ncbi:MAG: oligosaccharide flippase family protein [Actinomycetota bacterium]|jgi:O-antigen/teichoic acid export membrane protein|nr:oligosaccharide flippase family protein [Actinomycetota bacterium]
MDPAALSLKRRLASGGAWALGGRVLLALNGLATNALLGRLLSPQDLGIFFLAFSIVSFCTILSLMGLDITVLRFVAESLGLKRPGRARQAIMKIILLAALGTLGVTAAYLVFGAPLAARLFQAPALAALSGLIVGWILATTFQSLLAETFRGLSDIRFATLFSRTTTGFGSLASGLLLTAGLAALWTLEGQATLVAVMLLAVGSGLSGMLFASLLMRSKIKRLSSTGEPDGGIAFGQLLSVTWPLLVVNVTLLVLTQADLWIVGAFLPQEQVALYGASVRLVTLVIAPLLIVNAVVSPLVPENYVRGNTDELERLLRATATVAGIPAFLALSCFIFFGDPVLGIVFGDFYREGAFILTALSVGQVASVWAGSCGVVLVLTGNQVTMMAITMASGGATVVGGIIAVNYFGAPGVAVASAAGLILQSAAILLGAKLTTGMWTHCDFKSIPGLLRAAREGKWLD